MVTSARSSILGLCLLSLFAAPAVAQPGPVERVSVRAELAIDEMIRQIESEDWIVRHNGPWLQANEQWTNPAGVSFFPANTEYWVAVIVDECAGCSFELRFFNEDAGGYFSMEEVMTRESDGSLDRATGRFQVDADTRGELYLQMTSGSDLYKTYVILAQVR